MTATTVVPCLRRSKGFTIDSIIGKDSEKTDFSLPSSSQICHPRLRKTGNVQEEETRKKEININHADTVHLASHSRDTMDMSDIRNPVFFNSSSRDIFGAMAPAGDSLKHFQEAFLHNNIPCGSSRPCRHPVSSLNVPEMYSQQIPTVSPIHPMLLNNTRDFRNIYPFLTDRYPAYFLPRFGVSGSPGLFFQPYRKPKRIRTAFSPSQLLQLEKAFEKSHYVVGQERKDLAAELQLSETQVKVWFQNRRTKNKRTKTEEESGCPPQGHSREHDTDDLHRNDSNEESDISDINDADDSSNE
ncbi:hypothetical protein CHS0354_003352 [Potamilus streckersoni]|uniref:Homeobox domain-containing protein n=1 Tax=Potamilus streckersoni TaxID=2493646 RepID=A0AAE0S5F7_9BIVA|nr:hypothetical protein CHS0354_003352 [Potamilus streckersoni]